MSESVIPDWPAPRTLKVTVASIPLPLTLSLLKSIESEMSGRDPLFGNVGAKKVLPALFKNGPSLILVKFKTLAFQFKLAAHDQRFVTADIFMFTLKFVPICDWGIVNGEGLIEITVPSALAKPIKPRNIVVTMTTVRKMRVFISISRFL